MSNLMNKEETKLLFIAPFLIALFSFVFIVKTLDDPGLSWDEANFIPSNISYFNWYGILVSNAIGGKLFPSLLPEIITRYWYPTSEHPPFAKLLSGTTMFVFNNIFGLLFSARISSAIVFSFLILLVYKFLEQSHGPYAGIFSAVSLLIMPRVFGHAHIASIDICMAFTWFLTVFSFKKGIYSLKWSIITGISFGLALSTKINAVILPLPLIMWACLYKRGKCLPNFAAMVFISPVIFFLMWPWLWPSPFIRTLRYLMVHTHRAIIPVYYFGTAYKQISAPWHYPAVMTFLTLPPVILALSLRGIFKIAKNMILTYKTRIGTVSTSDAIPLTGGNLKSSSSNQSTEILIILNIITCIGAVSIPYINKYDGVRLFLPAFPFIASIAGIELNRILRLFPFFRKKVTVLIVGLIILSISALPLLRIHPYYLSYYNIFTGGVKGSAKHGFETTYWGDSCTENVLDYINKSADENAKICFYPSGCNVVPIYKLTGKLRKDIVETPIEDWESLDYVVLNCRQGFFDRKLWKLYRESKCEYATAFDDTLLTAVYRIH